MATALDDALRDYGVPVRRVKLLENLRRKAELISWDTAANEYLDLYRALAGQPTSLLSILEDMFLHLWKFMTGRHVILETTTSAGVRVQVLESNYRAFVQLRPNLDATLKVCDTRKKDYAVFNLDPSNIVDGLAHVDYLGYRRHSVDKGTEYILSYGAIASHWYGLEVHLIFRNEYIEYFLELFPKDKPLTIGMFRFFPRSIPRFERVFTSQPNFNDKRTFAPNQTFSISAKETSDQHGDGGQWIFAPPLLAVGLQNSKNLMVSLAPQPGHYNFNSLDYCAQTNEFHFEVNFGHHEEAELSGWTSPHLFLHFAKNPIDGLTDYRHTLLQRNWVAPPAELSPTVASTLRHYASQSRPIFTTWGAMLAASRPLPSHYYPDAAETARAVFQNTQANTEKWLKELEDADINPGILIIDVGWGDDWIVNTDRWPHLKNFIQAQHRKGRTVILWVKLWDSDGAPYSNMLRDDQGRSIPIDPTYPLFASVLRRRIQSLLSPRELDADGFKIDYSANVPPIERSMHDPHVAGIELIHRYVEIIYNASMNAKPTALLIAHTANPYFLQYIHILRRNDGPFMLNPQAYRQAMEHRGQLGEAAGWPLDRQDADGWPAATIDVLTEYFQGLQPGVLPNIFFGSQLTNVSWRGDNLTIELLKIDLHKLRIALDVRLLGHWSPTPTKWIEFFSVQPSLDRFHLADRLKKAA